MQITPLPLLAACSLSAFATAQVVEITTPTVPLSTIDMDLVAPAPGPTTLAAVNAAGTPVPGNILAITLTPSTAANPGVYNTNPTEGRALGLAYPGGTGLELLDPPSGQFTSFDARIDLGQPSTEFGMCIADWVGPMFMDFYNGPTLITTFTTSTYSTAAIKYFQMGGAQTFDRVDIRASTTGGNWVIPCLAVENGGGNFASKRRYGQGCIDARGTVFELFATAGAFDLSGQSMTLLYNGTNGYLALPGIGPYIAPTAAATPLTMTDDSEVTVTLAGPLPYPGGSTAALTVCSNGFVSTAVGNGTAYTPGEAAFLGFPQTVWATWHDFNPGAVGSGSVKFEQTGNLAIVTWDGVFDLGGSTPNTLQYQFDRTTGNVTIHWQSISGSGNAYLVGFKCGGSVSPVVSSDLSALLPGTFTTGCDARPLDLDASARPRLGTTVNVVTTNVPSGALITISRLTLVAQIPPIDLTGLGMPGCFQHVDLVGPDNAVLFGTPSVQRTIMLPNVPAFGGTFLYGQSVSLVPGINAFGAITSNGLELKVDVN